MTTELIVLHTTKYGENSIVIHTLSKEYGRRSFLVRNVGRKSASTSLLLPMNIIEADISETSRSTLYTARSLSGVHPLNGIRGNLYKNAITMFISEVLYRVIKDGVYEPGLYEWCEKSILLLDAIESDFSNFHLRFLLEFCIILGFSPEAGDLDPFVGPHRDKLNGFMQASFEEAMLYPLSGTVRNELASDILRYIEHHSESAVNIRSLSVLSELLR